MHLVFHQHNETIKFLIAKRDGNYARRRSEMSFDTIALLKDNEKLQAKLAESEAKLDAAHRGLHSRTTVPPSIAAPSWLP
jgi:hypothetical protein